MSTLTLAAARYYRALAGLLAANPFGLATYGVMCIGATCILAAMPGQPLVALFVCALLCGWCEVEGACGTSHVAALTPLRGLDRTNRLWLRATAAYTVAGTITAACAGAILGVLGLLLHAAAQPQLLFLAAALIIVLCAREIGVLRFQLPEVPRQTQKMWALHFGFVTGAAMWGAHIGLGFATVIKHGGLYFVAICALLLGPIVGAALFAAFWLGRTLPIWLTPSITADATHADGAAVMDLVMAPFKAYRACAALALLAVAAALFVLAVRS